MPPSLPFVQLLCEVLPLAVQDAEEVRVQRRHRHFLADEEVEVMQAKLYANYQVLRTRAIERVRVVPSYIDSLLVQ